MDPWALLGGAGTRVAETVAGLDKYLNKVERERGRERQREAERERGRERDGEREREMEKEMEMEMHERDGDGRYCNGEQRSVERRGRKGGAGRRGRRGREGESLAMEERVDRQRDGCFLCSQSSSTTGPALLSGQPLPPCRRLARPRPQACLVS